MDGEHSVGEWFGGVLWQAVEDRDRQPRQRVVSQGQPIDWLPVVTNYLRPADARRLRRPIFQTSGTEDQLTESGQVTRDLYRASPSPAERLWLIPSAQHGVDFISQGAGDQVRNAILAFIRAHTAQAR